MRFAATLIASLIGVPAALAGWSHVEGAPRWAIYELQPGSCWATTGAGSSFSNGDTAHAKLMLNNSNNLILSAGRPDWNRADGEIAFTLQIDKGAAWSVHGSAVMSLVVTEIEDAEMLARLKNASTLVWHLPWGDFTAHVDGLGKAFDAVAACTRGAPQ